ncbi:MAG: hypothetical protein DCC50_14880, partial [Acidobacteria bacterium]
DEAADAARTGTELGASDGGVVAALVGADLGLSEEAATKGDERAKGSKGAKGDKDAKDDERAEKDSGTKDDTPKDDTSKEKDRAEAPAPGAVKVNGSTFAPDGDGLLVPAGDTITAIGDSLVVTSADGLTYRFPGINYVAKSNRQWRDAGPVVDQALEEGWVRDNVVLHLGTNAGVDEDALRATLEELGPDRNVVVMNLFVNASFTDSSNAAIEKVVADYPNAVVGDWHGTISKRPQDLQADHVHPDMDGMHVYAGVVARAFDELADRAG